MRFVHFTQCSFINCVQALTVYALLLPELSTQLLLLSTTIMKSKRILSSVSLVFVLATTVFLGSFSSIQAQSYKKGVELNDTLVQYTQKKSFKYAGDKLMTLESFPDTVKKTQLLTITLLNPDFSTFKTFSRELPIDKYIMFYHNGVDVMEVMENGKPVYYWRYSSEDEIDGLYYRRTTVLNEASDSLYSIPVSYHGARVFEKGDTTKIVGEYVETDTIYYQIDDWHGWNAMEVQTSSIYDLKTGVKEFTFPRGTLFSQVAVVDDTARIYTQNNNMEMFLDDHHPLGSEANSMKASVYNMDYSRYKELDYSFSSIGLDTENVYNGTTYIPIYDGHNLFFKHSFLTYIKDEYGGVLRYSTCIVLTDSNGLLVKKMVDPTQAPENALWLPSKHETVFYNYNGVLLSCPEIDSIGKFTDFTVKEDGSVLFAQVVDDSVKLLNEALNLVGSFAKPSSEWSYSDMSQQKVVADSLVDFVFCNFDNGVQVLNETGEVVIDEPETTCRMDFMNYTPIFLMENGHKYANLVDDSLGVWYRVAPLLAEVKQANTLLPLSMQVYRQVNDSILLVDSVSETGMYEGLLPEGTYFVRTISDSLPSTYYPSALLWEDATPVSFTTDSLPVMAISQPANPLYVSPSNEGTISGTLSSAIPTLLWDVAPEQVRVYAVETGSSNVVAVGTLTNMAFELSPLPYGTYDVLMDIPGEPLLSIPTCMLSSAQKQGEISFSLLNNGVSGNVITKLAKQTAYKEFAIVPNPASDYIQFDAAFEGRTIELFDMTGRSVMSTTIQGRQVQIKQLPEGLYLVRV